MDASLPGLHLLATRPADRAASLVEAVRRAGGSAEPLPLLAIEPVPVASVATLLDRVDGYDIAVFVSVNAVEHAMSLLAARGRALAAHTVAAAVGEATAAALRRQGVAQVVRPAGREISEELLECPVMQAVAGRRVVIFRGQDGRELIASTLRQRGAEVDHATVYHRVDAGLDVDPVLRRWLAAPRPVLLLTSEAAGRILLARIADGIRDAVLAAPVVVPSERLQRYCVARGWRRVHVVPSPADEHVLSALCALNREETTIPPHD